jgi:hypothetical protein
MRIVCEDKAEAIVCSKALSRSPLLADMHEIQADRRVRLPCDTKTWTAWLSDDPSGLPAELVLDVIRVRSVYTQERWMLPCATGT